MGAAWTSSALAQLRRDVSMECTLAYKATTTEFLVLIVALKMRRVFWMTKGPPNLSAINDWNKEIKLEYLIQLVWAIF